MKYSDLRELSDHELVSMFQSGVKEAFGVIIERHSQKVSTIIYKLVKDSFLTEDLLQDTFIKTIKAILSGKYQPTGSFSAWITSVARNLTLDFLRVRAQKHKYVDILSNESSELSVLNFLSDPMDNPEEVMINNESEYDIHSLVNNLPKEQREVVILRHFQLMSFNEIADFTDVSINTALGRMRYALINLRKQIEEMHAHGKKVT